MHVYDMSEKMTKYD